MIQYLDIPVSDHGVVRVKIIPVHSNIGLEELGVDTTDKGELENLGIADTAEKVTQAATAVATEAFGKMTDTINTIAHGVQTSISSARPSEWSLEFNITFTADAGVVITHVSSEASFAVTLTWKSE